MTEPEHTSLARAAAHLTELRQRARLIRDSQRLTPTQKDQQRRILAAEMMQASGRFRALADSEDITPMGTPVTPTSNRPRAHRRGPWRQS